MYSQIKLLVAKYQELADHAFGITSLPIEIDLAKRTSTNAGIAYCGQWKIWINVALHKLHPEELEDTVGHEIAHLYAHRVFGTSGHDDAWRLAMRNIGLVPKRCHSMKSAVLIGKNMTIHWYRCSCCGSELKMSAKRHNSILRGAEVWHKGCSRSSSLIYIRKSSKHEEAIKQLQPNEMPIRMAARSSTPQPQPTKSVSKSGTKKERAQAIYDANPNATRQQIIQMFIKELDMTPTGASTYHYNCKKNS